MKETEKKSNDWFKGYSPEHQCSLDIEAYECPICARRLEKWEEEIKEKRTLKKESKL